MNVYKHAPTRYALALLGPLQQLSSLHYKLQGSSNAMCGQRSRKNTPWTCYAKDDARIANVKMCMKCGARHARMLALLPKVGT